MSYYLTAWPDTKCVPCPYACENCYKPLPASDGSYYWIGEDISGLQPYAKNTCTLGDAYCPTDPDGNAQAVCTSCADSNAILPECTSCENGYYWGPAMGVNTCNKCPLQCSQEPGKNGCSVTDPNADTGTGVINCDHCNDENKVAQQCTQCKTGLPAGADCVNDPGA